MNYGGDAADQIVRYSLDGVDHGLRLSGTLAKHLAVFVAAVLKDQKKTRGKTPDGADVKGKQTIEVLYRTVRPPERILQ